MVVVGALRFFLALPSSHCWHVILFVALALMSCRCRARFLALGVLEPVALVMAKERVVGALTGRADRSSISSPEEDEEQSQ